MRRKSERTASKKGKSSPEKKEKPKPTRTSRRRKQSSSSEQESETEPSQQVEESIDAVDHAPPPPAETVAKDDNSPEEAQEPVVWHVKTPQRSGDSGEIQKLKICLTRPPTTPERVDKSPKSKRKHTRATSSSDTPSQESGEEKRKSKHKSKKSHRDSNEDKETHGEFKGDQEVDEKLAADTADSSELSQDDHLPNQSNDDCNADIVIIQIAPESEDSCNNIELNKTEVVDNDPKSPVLVKPDSEEVIIKSNEVDNSCATIIDQRDSENQNDKSKEPTNEEDHNVSVRNEISSPKNEQSADVQETRTEMESNTPEPRSNTPAPEVKKDVQENNVAKTPERIKETPERTDKSSEKVPTKEIIQNGDTPAFSANRKRRWGSRKLVTQKSITISTDVLKDIIPDVKPAAFDEVIEEKKHKKIDLSEHMERPVLPKIVIDNTDHIEKDKENTKTHEPLPLANRKISIVKDDFQRPPSPPRNKPSTVLFITNLVRPFTLPQLKNLLQRTGKIVENGFWIDRIKSKCYVQYDNEDQAVETRHALHGVTWPVSNPKTLNVDFSTEEAFDKARNSEDADSVPTSKVPGTVEDWLHEQDMKRDKGEMQDRPWDRRVREWDVGKGEKETREAAEKNEKPERRRHRSPEKPAEPAKKFKKEEEAPAKMLDDLFRKTKTTPCIYWLPLSDETIAVKEEQRRQHMAENDRRLQELRRQRRH